MYKVNFYLILLICGFFFSINLQAQQNPEVKAIQYFNSGSFTESESLFQQLLEIKPADPMYNYYYGASRTENGHYGDKELECLTLAEKHFTPERLFYYLGIQYHARQEWSRALKYYNQFRMSIPQEEQDMLGLSNTIQLCFNHENPFATTADTRSNEITDKESSTFVTIEMNESLSASTETLLSAETVEETDAHLNIPRTALPNLPGVELQLPDGEQVEFRIDDIITYYFSSQFQTSEGEKLFEEGRALQKQQENNINLTDQLREKYKATQNSEERLAIASKIMALESETFHIEEKIRNAFAESRQFEKQFWDNADSNMKSNFLIYQDNLIAQLNKENQPQHREDEILLIDYEVPQTTTPTKTPPTELIYKIQIGAYSKGVPAYKQRIFNKLSVIRTIENYKDEKGVVVYTTGKLSNYEDALKMQNQVKQEGIQDAIVVPYINGKRITLEQAKQLEAKNDI